MALQTLLAPNASAMTLDGTRTFIVGRRKIAVIDPGPADERHLQALVDAVAGAEIIAILLTHAHPDHAAGAVALARRTKAPIMMARGALDTSIPVSAVTRWLADGDFVQTDAGVLRAIATAGHVPEHLAFSWFGEDAPAGGALFAGDLFMGEGDTTLIAPPEGNIADFFASLERMEQLAPAVIYPAHGTPLDNAAEVVRRYREHRRQRIRQVEAAMQRLHSADPARLVGEVYGPSLNPRLRAAAEASVRCMADYLQRTHP